jgi:hypothetical protein
MNDDLKKLLKVKEIYFRFANIHMKEKNYTEKSCVRQFLERDEKKLLYQSIYSTSNDLIDE